MTTALVPRLLKTKTANNVAIQIFAVLIGATLMTLLAQIKVYLPGTPVPVTGQTFGVFLIPMLFGLRLGFLSAVSYVALGALGLPVFAGASTLATVGPTLGYLFGMIVASAFLGFISEKFNITKVSTVLTSLVIAKAIIFAFGILGLSYFMPQASLMSLLMIGAVPFLPGGAIKIALATGIITYLGRSKV